MLLTLKIIDESCPVTKFVVTIKAWRRSKIINNCIYYQPHQLLEDDTKHAITLHLFPYNESDRAEASNATGLCNSIVLILSLQQLVL